MAVSAMAVLGLFVFGIQTLPYQNYDRATSWRHAANSRVGRRAGRQYLGVGDDIITLSGSLRPEITGGRISLEMLRYMADGGKAWPFIQGNGINLGMYLIEEISERGGELYPNGNPRTIDFSLKLTRVDEGLPSIIGTFTPELMAML